MVTTAGRGVVHRRALALEGLGRKLGSCFSARSANCLASLKLALLTCKMGSILVPTLTGWRGPWELLVVHLGCVQCVFAAPLLN